MNIKHKLQIVQNSIRSISQHNDEDATVVKAALDHIINFIDQEKIMIDAAIQVKITNTLLD